MKDKNCIPSLALFTVEGKTVPAEAMHNSFKKVISALLFIDATIITKVFSPIEAFCGLDTKDTVMGNNPGEKESG